MILIENAIIIKDPLGGEFSTQESVVVDSGEILTSGEPLTLRTRYPQAERLDADGCLLLPGLIDAHTHLYAALTVGMPGPSRPPQNIPEVLESVWWRWDKALREEDNYLSAIAGSIQSLRSGITTILDHHASPLAVKDSLSRVAAGIDAVGLRACLAYEVSDRDGPASRDQGIAENCRFQREVELRKDHRIRSLFGLHAVFSLSDETLRRCAEAAADLGTGCHMHMAEHRTEVEKFSASHSTSIAQYLNELGILGPKTILAHTVHIKPDDIRLLKSTQTFNVHNPVSNMSNGVGAARVVEMIQAGQPVGLGSDGFYDLPAELSTCRLLQTSSCANPSAFSGTQALSLVYDHNARFAERIFGRRFGKIMPGYVSDLILLDYEPFSPILPENLSSHILAALMSGQVRSAIVGGEVVMQAGKVTKVDESEVRSRCRVSAGQIWDRFLTSQPKFN